MHIIVASSNVFYRELSSFILSEAGYVVHECSDASIIVDCIQQVRPDMVLLDVRLAGTDSPELAKQIRQNSRVPIILLTNGQSGRSPLSAWGDAQLSWPYQPEDLLFHVQTLLHRPTPVRAAAIDVTTSP